MLEDQIFASAAFLLAHLFSEPVGDTRELGIVATSWRTDATVFENGAKDTFYN